MQLIEGRVCVFFLNKKKTDRSNRIRIESARVRGSNKDGRDVFLAVSRRWLRIQLLGLSWAGHSTRWEQLMKKN